MSGEGSEGRASAATLGAMSVPSIPLGHPTVVPHLNVSNARAAIEFYKKAFGAELGPVSEMPDGKVLHAELRIGNAILFLNDHFGPPAPAPRGVTLHIWTDKVDEMWERATGAGAQVRMMLEDQFWGDRYGQLEDPFGHVWSLAKQVKDVPPEERAKRAAEVFAKFDADPEAEGD